MPRMRKLFPIAIALIAVLAYHKFRGPQPAASEPEQIYADEPQQFTEVEFEHVEPSSWVCDGRKRCSQMHSCEEATWFIQHCSGMEMDGDGDGIPCERQWCGGR